LNIKCLIKGHEYNLFKVYCESIPRPYSRAIEFIDYFALGECSRCGKIIQSRGRVRTSYFDQPCSPVLASTPTWISEKKENVEKLMNEIVREYNLTGERKGFA
jgi:hypothetical protein